MDETIVADRGTDNTDGKSTSRSLRVPLLLATFALLAAWALLQGPSSVLHSMAPTGCAAGSPAELQGGLGSASNDDAIEIITGWHAFTRVAHGTVISRMETECISTKKANADRLLKVRNADTTVRVWLITDMALFAPAYCVLLLLMLAWARRLPDPAMSPSRHPGRSRPELPVLRGVIWLSKRTRLMTTLVLCAFLADESENLLLLRRLKSWWKTLDRTGTLRDADLHLGLVHLVGVLKWIAVALPLLLVLILSVRQVVRAALLVGRALSRIWVQVLLVVVFAALVVVPDQGADAIRRLSLWQWASTVAILGLFVVTIVLSAGEVLKPLAPTSVPRRPTATGDRRTPHGPVEFIVAAAVAARWAAAVMAIGAAIFVLSIVTGFRGLVVPALLVGATGLVSMVLDIVDDLDVPGAVAIRSRRAGGHRAAPIAVVDHADVARQRARAVGRVAPCLAGVIIGGFGFATLRATAGDFALIGLGPTARLALREMIGLTLTVATGLIVLQARRLLAWAERWTDRRRRTALIALAVLHAPAIAFHVPSANLAFAARLGTFSLVALFLSGFSLIGSVAARVSNALMARRGASQIALPSALRLLRLRSTPIIGLLAVWAVLASTVDNHSYHGVRQRAAAAAVPITVDDLATRWIGAQAAAAPRAGDTLPALLVAASGGGIRAAYWTAAVLDCLIERNGPPTDPCRGGPSLTSEQIEARRRALLTMSGISGGSLGLAEYVVAVGDQWDATGDDVRPLQPRWFRSRLGNDFLAPTVAAWLFNDGINALLRPSRGVDRAAVLERAWERAWPDGELAAPFFVGQTTSAQPALLLNGFSVEDGCRVLTSPLQTQPQRPASDCTRVAETGAAPAVFATADLHAQLCPGSDVSYATAALASARFPFVTPAGHLAACGDGSPIEIVDGGYRETSGASTLDELWPELRQALTAQASTTIPESCVAPIFLQIDNGYASDQLSGVGRGTVGQVIAPLQAVMNSSAGEEAAAREASHQLFADTPNGKWFRITTHAHPGSTAPLGWVLSADAQDDLLDQLRINGAAIRAIRELLDHPLRCVG